MSDRLICWLRGLLATSLGLGAILACDVHRADAQPVQNAGSGPIMQTPLQVYLIYWPGSTQFDPTNGDALFKAVVEQFFNDVAGTPYFNILTQYSTGTCNANPCTFQNGSGAVALGGKWADPDGYPQGKGTRANPLTDSDIQLEVQKALTVNPSWTIGLSSIFFVLTGAGVEACAPFGWCTFDNLCAYHASFMTSDTVIYAFMSDASYNPGPCGAFAATSVAYREIESITPVFFSAITDPNARGDSWVAINAYNYFEIGYLCSQHQIVDLNGNPYLVQDIWSNADNGCVYSYLAPAPPSNCYVWKLVCGNEASFLCDPAPTLLNFATRSTVIPPMPWVGLGFSPGSPQSPATGLYDAGINNSDDQFRVCAVTNNVSQCVAPVPYSPADMTGCPGGPPPPPPSGCRGAKCCLANGGNWTCGDPLPGKGSKCSCQF